MLVTEIPQASFIRNSSKNSPSGVQNKFLGTDYSVSFNGHLGSEKIFKGGKEYFLRNETAFFRDLQTKNFVKDYILKNFPNKSEIKMVIGGCSTGEEAYTYSMLLDVIKPKLAILGFDLSDSSIKQAKSGNLLMQKPEGNTVIDYLTDSYNDSYLCFPTDTTLVESQKKCKKLFDEFFEYKSGRGECEKRHLGERIRSWLMKKMFSMDFPRFENKTVKLKQGKAENCTFKVGDILELDKVLEGQKAEVITFSNAIYHLLTMESHNGLLRITKPNAKDIVKNIATRVIKNLNSKGLFVFGENEVTQMMDSNIVPKVLNEMGFEPLNVTSEHIANVYKINR